MQYRKLNEKIEDSGYKKSFIAKDLWVVRQHFAIS